LSTITSVGEFETAHATPSWLPTCSALEAVLVYAGILAYIWKWQHRYPQVWMVLLAVIVASQILHRDTFRSLGLTGAGMRANAELVLPISLAFYVLMLVYGFGLHVLRFLPVTRHAVAVLLGYGLWCAFQQYLTQSYFHNRLMEAVRNRYLRSLLVGVIFGAAHIPNPILMAATTLAGFVFAETFRRHRNIWPLALSQAVGGLLLAAVSPATLMHNMRVGPGYYLFGMR
jgi:hypothetical protein